MHTVEIVPTSYSQAIGFVILHCAALRYQIVIIHAAISIEQMEPCV